jgi:hypothetical protein
MDKPIKRVLVLMSDYEVEEPWGVFASLEAMQAWVKEKHGVTNYDDDPDFPVGTEGPFVYESLACRATWHTLVGATETD